MGLMFNQYFDQGHKVWGCKRCRTHFAENDKLVSKNFHGRNGDAWLFRDVINVKRAIKDEREMMTGRYIVQDVSCRHCSAYAGWVYVKAFDPSEVYKEGKFILELKTLEVVET